MTLSPANALSGTKWRSTPWSDLANCRNCSQMPRKVFSSKSTRSILFTATIICRIPISEEINVWRRVCRRTPLRASTRMIANSAVEAPVAILRVYCSWPGASAMMNLRRGVEKYLYATSIVMPCSRSALNPSVSRERSSSMFLAADAFRTEES